MNPESDSLDILEKDFEGDLEIIKDCEQVQTLAPKKNRKRVKKTDEGSMKRRKKVERKQETFDTLSEKATADATDDKP